MKGFNLVANSLVGLACLGMIMPQVTDLAQSPSTQFAQKIQIADIAVPHGVLKGKVVNSQGQLQTGVVITASLHGALVCQVVSNEAGEFALSNLGTGLHEFQAGEAISTVRLWSSAAPPSARSNILLVSDSPARGQILSHRIIGMGTLTTAVVVTGAIITAVVVANDDNNETPASP